MVALRLLLATFATTALASCQPKSEEQPAASSFCADFDEIKARGYITAICDLSSTSFFIYKGTPMGFEYELLKRFATEQGLLLRVEIANDMHEAQRMLQAGEGDVIAANFSVTKTRMTNLAFTSPLFETRPVAVYHKSAPALLGIEELNGKEIHLGTGSSFSELVMRNAPTAVTVMHADTTTEDLLAAVNEGRFAYTVADENLVRINKHLRSNIRVGAALSNPTPIAWALRQSSSKLTLAMNNWLTQFMESRAYSAIHRKYFSVPHGGGGRFHGAYSSLGDGQISPYDKLFQASAKARGIDWLLLAAMAKRESNFNDTVVAPSGATGLMQVLPEVAAKYGCDSLLNPGQNIEAGAAIFNRLNALWAEHIADSAQRLPFVLASYNAGMAHITDARDLARKHGKNNRYWHAVAPYLLKLAEPAYYRDPVVKHGYCRGAEPVRYVQEVLSTCLAYRAANL